LENGKTSEFLWFWFCKQLTFVSSNKLQNNWFLLVSRLRFGKPKAGKTETTDIKTALQ